MRVTGVEATVARMAGVRGVLFDFGNTLFAHASLTETVAQVARRLDADVTHDWAVNFADGVQREAHTADELRHPRDLDDAVWFERWHVLYARADDDVPGLADALYEEMHRPLSWQPFAATARTLQRLHAADVPVAVVSNTGWDVRAVFQAHGLDHLVRHFVLSYEVGAVKPSPAIFLAGCAALGTEPAATLMVGDDITADGGATRAGLRSLLLPLVELGGDNGVGAAADLALAN